MVCPRSRAAPRCAEALASALRRVRVLCGGLGGACARCVAERPMAAGGGDGLRDKVTFFSPPRLEARGAAGC